MSNSSFFPNQPIALDQSQHNAMQVLGAIKRDNLLPFALENVLNFINKPQLLSPNDDFEMGEEDIYTSLARLQVSLENDEYESDMKTYIAGVVQNAVKKLEEEGTYHLYTAKLNPMRMGQDIVNGSDLQE